MKISRFKNFENKEIWNNEEKYDKDYMAQSNIISIKQSVQYLDEIIDRSSKNIPDWVEDKLSRCSQDMQDIHNYFKSIKK
jgi:hypothetical protein